MTSHASFWEAVKGALHSLRGSKLRSFLTLLGIILATTTLIAVMSVISGMDVYIAQNVSSMGADGYRVTRIMMMQWDPKKFMEMTRRNPQLSREEFDFLRERAKLSSELGMIANLFRNAHHSFVMTHTDFVVRFLERCADLDPDLLDRASSNFFNSAIGGVRSSAPGVAAPRDVEQLAQAKQRLAQLSYASPARRLFELVAHAAQQDIDRSVADRLVLGEE